MNEILNYSVNMFDLINKVTTLNFAFCQFIHMSLSNSMSATFLAEIFFLFACFTKLL